MGSGINNKINKFLCNLKNVKKRRNTRLEKCYGHVNIATAFNNTIHCVLKAANVFFSVEFDEFTAGLIEVLVMVSGYHTRLFLKFCR